MTTTDRPYFDGTYADGTATTVRIPRQDRRAAAAYPAYGPDRHGPDPYAPVPAREVQASPRPALDATRLWTGGMATAVVAALVALVGVLVVRVLLRVVPAVPSAAGFGDSATTLSCVAAAGAALVATGLAHLLLVSTPRPLAYLGWIVGLVTAAATVLPLVGGTPLPEALAGGVIRLVIGLAIGALVTGAAASAQRWSGDRR
jgi:small-conductance mechanosensitive channel